MESLLSVLLVEGEKSACNEIINYIDTLDDLLLLHSTNNCDKAMRYVEKFSPDAVILDLELYHGSGNGLMFLRKLQEVSIKPRPYILITTNNSSTMTHDYARELGADFIMTKYQTDYSAQTVIEFLRMMKNMILETRHTYIKNNFQPESCEQKSKKLNQMISLQLNELGVSPNLVGYKYLIDAIQLTIKKPSHNLAASIGVKYKKSDASVERAMQNAINKAWRTSDLENLSKLYSAKISSNKGTPTVMEFVFYYANKIENES